MDDLSVRELLQFVKKLLEFNQRVEYLHAPTTDGEACQYCDDEYPCRTVRVLRGEEKIDPPVEDAEDEEEDEITVPKINTAVKKHPYPIDERKVPSVSMTKCTICGYRIDKDQEREVDKSRIAKELQAKHKYPSGCAESMRRYRKKGWDEHGRNTYYGDWGHNDDGS